MYLVIILGGTMEQPLIKSCEEVVNICQNLTALLTNVETEGYCDDEKAKRILNLAHNLIIELKNTLIPMFKSTHQIDHLLTIDQVICVIAHILLSDFSPAFDKSEEKPYGYLKPTDRQEVSQHVIWFRYIGNEAIKRYIPLISDIIENEKHDILFQIETWYRSYPPEISTSATIHENGVDLIPWLQRDLQLSVKPDPSSKPGIFARLVKEPIRPNTRPDSPHLN